MHAQFRFDEQFLDRSGCGDEFYLDSRSKRAYWLADSLLGASAELGTSLELELVDGLDDDVAYD